MNMVLVDDDVALLRSLELILAGRGHGVRTFHHPSPAVAHLARRRDLDVLVLDYCMPDMKGDEVLERIGRSLRSSTRIVVITGHTDVIEPRRLYELGASAILAKPLDLERLLLIAEADEEPGTAPTRGRDQQRAAVFPYRL
jgi:DNA-binding NtrC family response regulator